MLKSSLLIPICVAVVLSISACGVSDVSAAGSSPEADTPVARWDHVPGSQAWTTAALSALEDHGQPLVSLVPRDIETWCPAYAGSDDAARRSFWVGFLSALSKYESTYRPKAVGGGGKWFGLLQISPATARGYGCEAGSGAALKSGPANLSCAIRIMATTVTRDGVVHGHDAKWRGVSADWGPMRSAKKRASIAAWVSSQDYCTR